MEPRRAGPTSVSVPAGTRTAPPGPIVAVGRPLLVAYTPIHSPRKPAGRDGVERATVDDGDRHRSARHRRRRRAVRSPARARARPASRVRRPRRAAPRRARTRRRRVGARRRPCAPVPSAGARDEQPHVVVLGLPHREAGLLPGAEGGADDGAHVDVGVLLTHAEERRRRRLAQGARPQRQLPPVRRGRRELARPAARSDVQRRSSGRTVPDARALGRRRGAPARRTAPRPRPVTRPTPGANTGQPSSQTTGTRNVSRPRL